MAAVTWPLWSSTTQTQTSGRCCQPAWAQDAVMQVWHVYSVKFLKCAGFFFSKSSFIYSAFLLLVRQDDLLPPFLLLTPDQSIIKKNSINILNSLLCLIWNNSGVEHIHHKVLKINILTADFSRVAQRCPRARVEKCSVSELNTASWCLPNDTKGTEAAVDHILLSQRLLPSLLFRRQYLDL